MWARAQPQQQAAILSRQRKVDRAGPEFAARAAARARQHVVPPRRRQRWVNHRPAVAAPRRRRPSSLLHQAVPADWRRYVQARPEPELRPIPHRAACARPRSCRSSRAWARVAGRELWRPAEARGAAHLRRQKRAGLAGEADSRTRRRRRSKSFAWRLVPAPPPERTKAR